MGKTDALSQRVDHGTGSGDNDNMTLLSPDLFVIRVLEGLTAVGEERDVLREIRGTPKWEQRGCHGKGGGRVAKGKLKDDLSRRVVGT
jgi:hypothetical protein